MASRDARKPELRRADDAGVVVARRIPTLGEFRLHCDAGGATLLFTENETNAERLFGSPNVAPYVKDAFNDYVVARRDGRGEPASSPARRRRRCTASDVAAGGERDACALRLGDASAPGGRRRSAPSFDADASQRGARRPTRSTRRSPARQVGEDAANVIRQALAGLLWAKQFYHYNVERWLRERPRQPVAAGRAARGRAQRVVVSPARRDVISMPDKWEYPWFAAWDLAFQTIPLVVRRRRLRQGAARAAARERYMHPNGQIPAYEWNFCGRQPAGARVGGAGSSTSASARSAARATRTFLERVFQQAAHQLHVVGEPQGRRRPQRLRGRLPRPGQHRRLRPLRAAARRRHARAGRRHRVDGVLLPDDAADGARAAPARPAPTRTWPRSSSSTSSAIADATNPPGGDALWDEEDGFYYDLMRMPDGSIAPAAGALDGRAGAAVRGDGHRAGATRAAARAQAPHRAVRRTSSTTRSRRSRRAAAGRADGSAAAGARRRASAAADARAHARRVGVPRRRTGSARCRATTPSTRTSSTSTAREFRIEYEPAESRTGMFGGNSNWRGPVWFPMNVVILSRRCAAARISTATTSRWSVRRARASS